MNSGVPSYALKLPTQLYASPCYPVLYSPTNLYSAYPELSDLKRVVFQAFIVINLILIQLPYHETLTHQEDHHPGAHGRPLAAPSF